MKIDKVKVNYGRTVQIIRFEPHRIDVELSATLDDGESWQKVVENLRQKAKLEVQRMIKIESDRINKRDTLEDIY